MFGQPGNTPLAFNARATAAPISTNTSYDPYSDKWAYTDTGAKQTGYLPKILASDIQNGKFVGGNNYGQFAAQNMASHGDNYQQHMNQDGTFTLGVKTDGKNRLDTTYVKQGDYYVPQKQANAYWDTGSGGFLKNTLKDVAPIASIAAMAIPGLQPFALGLNALNAGMNGDWKGALMSALPVAGNLAGAGSSFMNAANGLQSANSGYNAYKQLQNGNLLGALGAGASAYSGANNLFGGSQANSQLASMIGRGAGVAQNVQRGNLLGAASGGLGLAGYGQAAQTLNGVNSLYNATQQRGTPALGSAISGLNGLNLFGAKG